MPISAFGSDFTKLAFHRVTALEAASLVSIGAVDFDRQGAFHRSVKVFVRRIELGNHDIDDLHCTDRPMPHSRRNPNTHPLPQRDDLVIKLHFGLGTAFQDEVSLGQPLVIMKFSVFLDFGHMDRCRVISHFGECPFRDPAGARSPWQLLKVDDLPLWLYGTAHECVSEHR